MTSASTCSGAALAWSLDRDGPAMIARRIAASDRFMATRNTGFARLGLVIGGRVEHIRHLLLTSSPVHGLANATSDIDTICIVEGEALGERTATQVFDAGNHYETIPFSLAELTAERTRLRQSAALPGAAAIKAFNGWDKAGPISRKYLERIINGIAVDGSAPYLDSLPDLARLWRVASLARALAMHDCARLSLAAGEPRGAIGYAINALLYAVEVLLAHFGHVYSSRKWGLLRLERFAADDAQPGDGRSMAASLAATWIRAEAALGDLSTTPSLVAEVAGHLAALAALTDLPLTQAARWQRLQPPTTVLDFLPGMRMQLSAKRLQLLPKTPEPARFLGHDDSVDRQDARVRLHAARSGLLIPTFEPEETTP